MEDILKYLVSGFCSVAVATSIFLSGYAIGDARRDARAQEKIQCILADRKNFGRYKLSEMALNDAYLKVSPPSTGVEEVLKEMDTNNDLEINWLEHYSWRQLSKNRDLF